MIPVDEFWTLLDGSLADGSFLGTTFSKRRPNAIQSPERLIVRPTTVKSRPAFQWVSRSENRETHENLPPDLTGRHMRELLGTTYEHAHFFTTKADFEVRIAEDGLLRIRRGRPTKTAASLTHNRSKTYLLPENVPCPFLTEIGVMTPAGRVRASKYAKFRQINRFLELVDDVADALPPTGLLRIVDFGCGKSYLTFALHHLLTNLRHRDVDILGLDRKCDVVEDCARLAKRLDCRGLGFRVGEIAGQRIDGTVDLAVSLHACDTATDDALAQAVRWKASVIFAVPCCQHELAGAIHVDGFSSLQSHGVLNERFASLATDALRARALEACGYKTQVVEFIDLEHTAKNLLIRAVRQLQQAHGDDAASAAYREFKKVLGVTDVAADRIVAAASA